MFERGVRLKAAREIMAGLTAQGIPCDLFTANRIIGNLWAAYKRDVEGNPRLEAAVLNGEFQIKGGEV